MNWIDIILLFAMGTGIILGAISGTFWQLIRMLAVLLSLYITIYFHETIQPWLSYITSNRELLPVLSYLIFFFALYFVLFFISLIVEYATRKKEFARSDRIFGSFLGLMKAVLICGAIMLGFIYYPVKGLNNDLKTARMSTYLLNGMRAVTFAIPSDNKQLLRDFLVEEPPAINEINHEISQDLHKTR